MSVKSKTRWTGQGLQLTSCSDFGHGVLMDAAEKVGGTDTGPRPMEMLLHSLAGCTSMDVVSLLKRMRVEFTGLEVNVEADEAPEHPKTYTKVNIEYVITGRDVDRAKVEKAINLSQDKYCSVSAMLRKHCPINHTLTIRKP